MQRRFRAVDAGFIALVLAWRGHPSPELDMKRFPTPSLLAVALIGAFAAGGPWAQTAVQLGPAKAATKDASRTAARTAEPTSELQSLLPNSFAHFILNTKQ